MTKRQSEVYVFIESKPPQLARTTYLKTVFGDGVFRVLAALVKQGAVREHAELNDYWYAVTR